MSPPLATLRRLPLPRCSARLRFRLLLRAARIAARVAANPTRLFALVSIAIPAFAGLLVYSGAGDEANRLQSERLRATAQIMAEHGNAMLGLTVEIAGQVAEEAQRRGIEAITHDRAFQDWLTDIVTRSPFIRSVVVTDRSGRAVATSAGFPPTDVSYADRDQFQALESGYSGPFLGRPTIGRVTELPLFPVAVPIRDRQGAFIGTAQIGVWAHYLGRVLVRDLGSTLTVAWLRADGWLLQRIPEAAAPRQVDPEGSVAVISGVRSERARSTLGDIFSTQQRLDVAVVTMPDWPLAAIAAVNATETGSIGIERLVLIGFTLCGAASTALALSLMTERARVVPRPPRRLHRLTGTPSTPAE